MSLIHTVKKDRKIYGNYKVYSPEGHLMFRCGQKKVNWYLTRDLANIIDNDPFKIQLKFQPQGLGNHNKKYGLTEMHNRCVVCGTDDYLTRHHVVPICYRKFFPMDMKSHNFHDVLSLCVDCHEKYEKYAFSKKLELAEQYEAPINGELLNNKDFLRIKRMSSCLIKDAYPDIPKYRIKEIKKDICDYFGWKRITQKRIDDIINIKVKVYNRTHGEVVISKISDINEFIRDWRNHFIEIMQCKYLPKNWSVDNE